MDTKKAFAEKIPSSQLSKQDISRFLRLPRELRDIIYCDALSAGSLGILTVSKFIHQEASQLVSKHAVLRINLGFASRTNWSQLGSGSVASVQHLDLHINARSEQFSIGVISSLNGGLIVRKSGIITLHYSGRTALGYIDSWHNAYHRQLARLNGFESLTFVVAMERMPYAEWQHLMTEEEFHKTFDYDLKLTRRHRETYENLRRYLERLLGPAVFDRSVEGHCLRFRPLEPVPEGWSPELKSAPRIYSEISAIWC